MKVRVILILTFLSLKIIAQVPKINTAKPWAYWWWMGNAVTEAGIRKNLQDYAKAGMGGLHIIPIYGVKGYEKDFLPFLSPKWNAMLNVTLQEAQRLGLGIDLSLGTGWPYGGPWVKETDGAKKFIFQGDEIRMEPTRQQVKRAAPGGEGLVMNPFDPTAVQNYVAHFEMALPKSNNIRSFYNDSYEVYGATWTNDFLTEFTRRRGYVLDTKVLNKKKNLSEDERRQWADYHTTLSELLRDRFTRIWTDWSQKQGKITRDQAHGSPGNILDLYALASVPETEYFGSKQYAIPNYRLDPAYDSTRFGVPGTLTMQFASSAAHLTGKPLVSSETSTWLGEHFRVSLSQIKPIVDELFTGGVNHIFYHGIPYSPPGEAWPGWLFYASTNYNQQSHFWKDLPALNQYITECQTRLQTANPDADLLLYFPIQDVWHGVAAGEAPFLFDVHANSRRWLNDTPFGHTATQLRKHGYQADFISDSLLNNLTVVQGKLKTASHSYPLLLVPETKYMPMETLRKLDRLVRQGAKVMFVKEMPLAVAGYNNWQARQKSFEAVRELLRPLVKVSEDYLDDLRAIRHESMAQQGLSFIRKTNAEGTLYFITNLSNQFHRDVVELATDAHAAQLFDPTHQRQGYVPIQKHDSQMSSIELALEPGESVFVQTYASFRKGKPWPAYPVRRDSLEVKGIWKIDFLQGEPKLPIALGTSRLVSWTELDHAESENFSGTARYTLNFKVPADWQKEQTLILDLGDVRESAEVRINDVLVGKSWSLPHRLAIPGKYLKAMNKLEVDVTNLSANRIRQLDQEKVPWKKFYDINFVSIRYEPFDASKWEPEPSGLLGPVVLWR
ncbi:MAG: glycosyl hydrolase [Siphonobacter sp.]